MVWPACAVRGRQRLALDFLLFCLGIAMIGLSGFWTLEESGIPNRSIRVAGSLLWGGLFIAVFGQRIVKAVQS